MYARRKGHNYELRIINELKELGYKGVVSTRSASRLMDAQKIDIIDQNEELPIYIQCKCTQNTPDFLEIKKSVTTYDKPFVIFWNKQVLKDGNKNMNSLGEMVILSKEDFYDLCIKKT